jgi:rhodanese-related sulfurtransferase
VTVLPTFEVPSARRRLTASRLGFCQFLRPIRVIASVVERSATGEIPVIIDNPGQIRRGELVKLTAAEVKHRMDRGERFVFVDARTIDEWIESGDRIPGSVRITPAEVVDRAKVVPQGRTVITYCSCPREEASARVAVELMRLGFLNVYPLIGGLDAWRAAGGAVERR